MTGLIAQIHDSPTHLVLAVTGGGSGAISALLAEPGASRTVLEAVVPYANSALTDLLGGEPEQYCSEPTARLMAMAAFRRARRLADEEEVEHLAGVGCTASLASDRPKRGEHRIYVAVQTLDFTLSYSLVLEKGARSRREEEEIAAGLVLDAVAEACGLKNRGELALRESERIAQRRAIALSPWRELIVGRIDGVCMRGGRVVEERRIDDLGARSARPQPPSANDPNDAPTRFAVFPGAFHPLHEGHREMAALAAELVGCEVQFELTVENVDKPPLDYAEIADRLAQFTPDQAVWLTRTPTFARKADLLPGCTFLVGADTMVRIAQPRYYGGEAERDAAIDHLAERGCRFLVFGRLMDGRFQTLADLRLPPQLTSLCDEAPPERFRVDVSSTEIRRGRRAPE